MSLQFQRCLPQMFFGPFLSTLTQMTLLSISVAVERRRDKKVYFFVNRNKSEGSVSNPLGQLQPATTLSSIRN